MTLRLFFLGMVLGNFGFFSGCTEYHTEAEHSTIKIAAAASVKGLVKELAKEFSKKYPDIHVQLITGSSGKLYTQLLHGLTANVFMSADMMYPQLLVEKERTFSKPKVYAKGRLIFFSAHGKVKGDFLKTPCDGTIAIANPALAPYGRAAKQALRHFRHQIPQSRLITAKNVSHCIHYSLNGATYGFLPLSALNMKSLRKYKNFSTSYQVVPKEFHEPIAHGVVQMKTPNNVNHGKLFLTFLFSTHGKQTIKKWGFDVRE